MKQFTQNYTIGVNKESGSDVAANGNYLAVMEDGTNVWFPKNAKPGAQITFKLHEKGDYFIPKKDSTRTKGDVMGEKCPAGKEDEPLYFKGETVPRAQNSIEFIGFAGEKILTFSEKAQILASLGIAVKL